MSYYGIDFDQTIKQVESEIEPVINSINKKALANHAKVLNAFRKSRVSDFHMKGSTGYGYSDRGRDKLEEIFAEVFRAETALVRSQIVSGTHAIALCLFGILRPGDELLVVQGEPYDTMAEMIGIRGNAYGSLKQLGIGYKQINAYGVSYHIDLEQVGQALTSRTRMIMLQRSMGYNWGPPLDIEQIKKVTEYIKGLKHDAVVFVDNCYGEFVEEEEPIEAGADLIAGSLIKNPGGGLAPTGGYVAGKAKYVEMAANRWSAPGLGSEVGPSPENIRLLFQGLFLAPHFVAEALKGAVFTAKLFESLGYEVLPGYNHYRTDIVQAIKLGTPEKMLAFCRAVQEFSPVDSHVRPEADDMPGYSDQVVMAAGTFIQGASLELSADGPMRPPYAVYVQGGLSSQYVKLAIIAAARRVLKF